MLQMMNLGVLMAQCWQKLHKPQRNCTSYSFHLQNYQKLAIFSFSLNFFVRLLSFHLSVGILCSTECQMVMNVLWTRLTETGKNWRFVYKVPASNFVQGKMKTFYHCSLLLISSLNFLFPNYCL